MEGNEDEPLCCRNCDRRFERLADLKTHEKSHDVEKPFDCTECDKTFPNLSESKQHKRTHICPFYKKGQCNFGPRGKSSQGQCQFSHPRPCMYHESSTGCKKGDKCDFLHRVNKVNQGGRQRRESPNGNMSFLDQGQMMMMEILQQLKMLNQDRNNNGRQRGPQWPMN